MLVNTQPREHRVADTDLGCYIEVVGIWQTIQGEGPFTGQPAIFVRLAGCNLRCAFCDTDYTSGRESVHFKHLVQRIDAVTNKDFRPTRLVVITGGEPFRQNIWNLVKLLTLNEYRVQIETNGTYYQELDYDPVKDLVNHKKRLTIVCSPKTPTLHLKLLPHIDALKYVVSAEHVSPYDGLPNRVLGSPYMIARPWEGFKGEIYLQPEDHKDPATNNRNIKAAVNSCLKFGYRLSLQTHKWLGLD